MVWGARSGWPPRSASKTLLTSCEPQFLCSLLGSFEFRAGFASASSPSVVFDNVVSKYRDRKKNINVLLAGGDAFADAQSRGSIRSPFDGDVVCGFDVMVSALASVCGSYMRQCGGLAELGAVLLSRPRSVIAVPRVTLSHFHTLRRSRRIGECPGLRLHQTRHHHRKRAAPDPHVRNAVQSSIQSFP